MAVTLIITDTLLNAELPDFVVGGTSLHFQTLPFLSGLKFLQSGWDTRFAYTRDYPVPATINARHRLSGQNRVSLLMGAGMFLA